MLPDRATTKEQRAPDSHFRLALSPAVNMQLEFSSQSAEQDGPQVPLQLFSCGHSQLQLVAVQGAPTKPQRSSAQLAGPSPPPSRGGTPASME
jgi:hypothetical protein